MDTAALEFLKTATPSMIYLAAVYFLWQKLNAQETKYGLLVDRYHDLLIEQVETLTMIKDKLNGTK